MSELPVSKKQKEEATVSELPEDLIIDIIQRLSVKLICQLKRVCKSWRYLLSSPRFVRAHLVFHKDDPKQLISSCLSPNYCVVTLTTPEASDSETSSEDGEVIREGQFPVEQNILLAGSCDGLVLLVVQDAERSNILFNPITLETAKFFDNRDLHLMSPCVYGFGYDRSSDDYKIVSLSKIADDKGSLVDVYSVRMKSWKRIANSRYALQIPCIPRIEKDPAPGVFLNGRIHWLGSATNPTEYGFKIVCFDLAREEFVEVPLALDRKFNKGVQFDISVIDGCLALSMLPHAAGEWWNIHVWVMKEYGVRDSWTQIAVIADSSNVRRFVNIVCALNEDEIVIASERGQLCVCNYNLNSICPCGGVWILLAFQMNFRQCCLSERASCLLIN